MTESLYDGFNSDGGSAEQLAGKLLFKRSTAKNLPQVKVVAWDLAHGLKRFITKKKSIVRMVQNSPELHEWLRSNQDHYSCGAWLLTS
eukprot:4593630-Amphidinium_carterae.1